MANSSISESAWYQIGLPTSNDEFTMHTIQYGHTTYWKSNKKETRS